MELGTGSIGGPGGPAGAGGMGGMQGLLAAIAGLGGMQPEKKQKQIPMSPPFNPNAQAPGQQPQNAQLGYDWRQMLLQQLLTQQRGGMGAQPSPLPISQNMPRNAVPALPSALARRQQLAQQHAPSALSILGGMGMGGMG